MKYKTTQREVKEGYCNVICVPYVDLQHLLQYESPVAYTTRREGWGADIYQIDSSTAIATGYAPFGNVRPSYELRKRYDDEAREVGYDYSLSWEERRDKLRKMLQIFVEEVTK